MSEEEAIKIILDAILSLQINSIIKDDILQKLIKENREKYIHIAFLYIMLIILSICVYLK
ncbi:hypothetical protein RN96_10530 [Fusobacterium polymorphum]|uniref:Uncharacterized protein n=1 Tax=Fusobacterium nucleatum subsp. polymorphum TaxID=76857 RepID=A0A2B7YHV1_FUSNP|nr:hypothetical protein [Fusobacterium polymorphum]PGH20603.1 hypothetical protein RN96_10530 [Fusobacterium polymorphum]